MKSRLDVKFIGIYLLFGFISLFITAGLTNQLIYNYMEKKEAASLYREATLLSSDFLPDFFEAQEKKEDASVVYAYLSGARTYLESSLWLTDTKGSVLTSVTEKNMASPPKQIKNFSPVKDSGAPYSIGDYHGHFQEEVITVLVPVTHGFSTKGYLLIHKPTSWVEKATGEIMVYVYLTLVILYLLSFSILLMIRLTVLVPLRNITDAATQYASGNLQYQIPIKTHDEIGYLSASLNYMASQIKDMEDYQKKFIANVSHDFRSPLTSIKGYVEAMADGTIPPSMQNKYLNIILFETERLTDLTGDLLTLNEFDTQELLLNKETFDIHTMLKNTVASFEGVCTRKRIRIELLLATKTLLVYGDCGKLQQVLYNLIDNGIKFSEDDSTLTIETTEQGDKVYISIKDEGIGIPKNEITKIWERFYKSDLSRGKDKKGTGLGLSIVKEILQSHGENINVISTEGVGTEFIFSLPISK